MQPDHRHCEATRFQPFRFSTNSSTFCVFEKTNCGDEGQIIFRNGSTSLDRQCRCDYTRGYAFTTKPDHGCFCVPSMEDCSCYHKPCPSGLILGPGKPLYHSFLYCFMRKSIYKYSKLNSNRERYKQPDKMKGSTKQMFKARKGQFPNKKRKKSKYQMSFIL